LRRFIVLILLICAVNLFVLDLPAQAGGTREIAIGTFLGMGMGVTLGGAVLLFSPNNETSDENLDTFLWSGVAIGGAGGFVLGSFVPEGAGFTPGVDMSRYLEGSILLWPAPFVAQYNYDGEQQTVLGANLIHLVF